MSCKSIPVLTFLVLCSIIYCSELGQQKSLAVTIYNDDFAMVKDVREISFDKGSSFLYFTDVSSNIQAETVTFKALTNPQKIKVYEQNYEENLVSQSAILKKYLNKEVELYVVLGETTRRVNGTLLGYSSGYIVKTQYGIDVFSNVAGVQVASLPKDFFTVPTLNWKVFSEAAIKTDCQVAYRTTGFSWKADYSVVLNSDEDKADIGGWVTIDNNSGKKYVQAKLKLIAGDVNTVQQNNYGGAMYMKSSYAESSAGAAPSFSEKSFGDYHLYTLSLPVTLNQASKKQVEFIPKVFQVKVQKYHVISISAGGNSQANLKAKNKINFNNSKEVGLGIPLPKGTVRVFKEDDSDKSLEFIGEDSIDHTPKDENVSITTGNAFDITANKYSEQRQSYDRGGYSAKMNLTISNHKTTSAQIEIRLSNYYADNLRMDWQSQGTQLTKWNANQYRWRKVFAPNESYTFKWSEDYRP